MSSSRARVWLALALLASPACAASHKPGPSAAAELRVIAVPENAVVQVNETFVGSARVLAQRPARLTTGEKRVTITAPGYFPHDMEVTLAPGVTTVKIKLRPVPP